MGRVPTGHVRIAGPAPELGRDLGEFGGPLEVTGPNREHHVDRRHHVIKGEMRAGVEGRAQLRERSVGMWMPGQQQVRGPPHQSDGRLERIADRCRHTQQFVGESRAQHGGLGAEQAVQCQVQGLGEYPLVRAASSLVEGFQYAVPTAFGVVGFRRLSDPQPHRERAVGRQFAQRPPTPELRPRISHRIALFVQPQSANTCGGLPERFEVVVRVG